MKIKVNKQKCIGCGTCAALAMETFEVNKHGKAEVKNPTGDNQEIIQAAAKSCPVGAIEIEDES